MSVILTLEFQSEDCWIYVYIFALFGGGLQVPQGGFWNMFSGVWSLATPFNALHLTPPRKHRENPDFQEICELPVRPSVVRCELGVITGCFALFWAQDHAGKTPQ